MRRLGARSRRKRLRRTRARPAPRREEEVSLRSPRVGGLPRDLSHPLLREPTGGRTTAGERLQRRLLAPTAVERGGAARGEATAKRRARRGGGPHRQAP